MSEHTESDIDALEDLLDAERSALLLGKLDDVSRLHTQKERLIGTLSVNAEKNEAKFEGLTSKIKRNQALLNSALDGIRSVSRRLSAIKQVRHSLETYDALGRKLTVDIRTEGKLEKRS